MFSTPFLIACCKSDSSYSIFSNQIFTFPTLTSRKPFFSIMLSREAISCPLNSATGTPIEFAPLGETLISRSELTPTQ